MNPLAGPRRSDSQPLGAGSPPVLPHRLASSHVRLVGGSAIAFCVTCLLCLAGEAIAQGGVLLYTLQPLSGPAQKQIHRISADGTGDTTLTNIRGGANYPDWSPDASRIAMGVYVSGTVSSIYSMNTDGSGLTRLTNTAEQLDSEPSWSPDGTRIIFARRAPNNFEDEQLWLMNADGSELALFSDAGSAPEWSPDGTRIAYQSNRDGSYAIHAIGSDGSDEIELAASGGDDTHPAWSPDGTRIAFVSTRDGNPEIYVMNADGSGQTRLTNNTVMDFTPSWSPDGSLIAFGSDESGAGHWEVHLIRADGSNRRRVTYMPANLTAINPDWMPQDLSYLGRPRPGLLPERFPPTSLLASSDWFWHGAPVFSPDLKEMYWGRYARYATPDRTELAQVRLDENLWSSAASPTFADTAYTENNPFFKASNDTLYYFSEQPGGPWLRVTRTPTGWSSPVSLSVPLPPGASVGSQFGFAGSGALYFEIWVGPSRIDLYRSQYVDGAYQAPEALAGLNMEGFDFCPYIDPAERFILFCSNRPGGYGLNDIYFSRRDSEGAWSPPVNLGLTINSAAEDAFPNLSPDGRYFFFVTERAGDLGYNPYWLDAQFIYDMLEVVTPVGLTVTAHWTGSAVDIEWYAPGEWRLPSFEVQRTEQNAGTAVDLEEAAIQHHGSLFHLRDDTVEPGKTYTYAVVMKDRGVAIDRAEATVQVPKLADALLQNQPNPFVNLTTIPFALAGEAHVRLDVLDVQGRPVRTLLDERMQGGVHSQDWDGHDSFGRQVANGLYFYRLTVEVGPGLIRKALLLR